MKAPRRWTSIELLLRQDDDDEPRDYRSVPGGRVEPRPNGHEETASGEWRDGLRVTSVAPDGIGVSFPARFAQRPVTRDLTELPQKLRRGAVRQ